MSKILLCSSRGTKSNLSENIPQKYFTQNKQSISFISKKEEGKKITSCRGTKALWIKQQTKKIHPFSIKQILVVNRGTGQIII